MNIDIIDELIKDNRIDDFKLAFKNLPLNSHHKSLIFNKCFLANNVELVDYLGQRIPTPKEQLIGLLVESLKLPIHKKLLKYFNNLTDVDVIGKIDNSLDSILKNQNSETFNWIVDKFPLTIFKNFKSVVYSSIKYNKYDYISHLMKTKLDTETCFNICLCCFEYKKPDLIEQFLRDQVLVNPEVINQIKNNQEKLFQQYIYEKELRQKQLAQWQAQAAARAAALALKYPTKSPTVHTILTPTTKVPSALPKQEQVNLFFEENLAKALHDYLENKLPSKGNDIIKKNKI